MKLLCALGNPEPDYTSTRHNIGFLVLNNLAEKFRAKWVNKPKLYAIVTKIKIDGEKILLVKPTTFYNNTGLSIKALINFYKLNPDRDLLIVHDDLVLPFGTIRTRQKGSHAGNNGIKSINAQIGINYHRVRIGTRTVNYGSSTDSDFVMTKFNQTEQKMLEKIIIPTVIDILIAFSSDKFNSTSYKLLD